MHSTNWCDGWSVTEPKAWIPQSYASWATPTSRSMPSAAPTCAISRSSRRTSRCRGGTARTELPLHPDDPVGGQCADLAQHRSPRQAALTDAGDGEQIVGYVADDDRDEAAFVVNEIQRLTSEGLDAGEIAIFYRTHAQSRPLEEVLLRSGLKHRIVGNVRFYERREVRDALAYLRAVSIRG